MFGNVSPESYTGFDWYRYFFRECMGFSRYFYLFEAYNQLLGHFFYKHTGINGENIYMEHFLISNSEVTAKFLSRYLMKKIEQNVRPRYVINPLRREFTGLVSRTIIKNYKDEKNKNIIANKRLKQNKQYI